jgi:hypothetical protein
MVGPFGGINMIVDLSPANRQEMQKYEVNIESGYFMRELPDGSYEFHAMDIIDTLLDDANIPRGLETTVLTVKFYDQGSVQIKKRLFLPMEEGMNRKVYVQSIIEPVRYALEDLSFISPSAYPTVANISWLVSRASFVDGYHMIKCDGDLLFPEFMESEYSPTDNEDMFGSFCFTLEETPEKIANQLINEREELYESPVNSDNEGGEPGYVVIDEDQGEG